MKSPLAEGEELIERVNRIGGLIFGVSENRSWIELFYEGDHTHIKSVELPGDIPLFDIFVEEIPHKATIYEHPRIMIHFAGPCDLEIVRDGNKIVIRGCAPTRSKGSGVKVTSKKKRKGKQLRKRYGHA